MKQRTLSPLAGPDSAGNVHQQLIAFSDLLLSTSMISFLTLILSWIFDCIVWKNFIIERESVCVCVCVCERERERERERG